MVRRFVDGRFDFLPQTLQSCLLTLEHKWLQNGGTDPDNLLLFRPVTPFLAPISSLVDGGIGAACVTFLVLSCLVFVLCLASYVLRVACCVLCLVSCVVLCSAFLFAHKVSGSYVHFCPRPCSEHLSMGQARNPPTHRTTIRVYPVLSCRLWPLYHRMCVSSPRDWAVSTGSHIQQDIVISKAPAHLGAQFLLSDSVNV